MITYPDSFFTNQSPLWSLAVPLVVLLFIAAPLLGLLIALVSGGTACLHHVVLRLLLWRSGAIPWNLAQFLDYAGERLFLRRVGGSYMFVHRLLLEHIAATDGAAWQDQVQPCNTGSVTINLKREHESERFQTAGLQRTRFTGRRFDHIAERLPQRRRLIGRLSAGSTLILMTMALSIGLVLYTPDQRLERTLTGSQPIRALELAGTEIVAVGAGTRNLQRWTPEGTVQTVAVSAPNYGIAYALSPNGAIYAVGTADQTTELRRSSDGALLHTLPGYNAHFAPDNERVLTEIQPNQIKIWSITDGAELGALTPPRPIHSPMAFSANGDTVALVDGTNVVQFWSLTPPHTPIGQVALPTGIITAPGSPAMAYGWMPVNVTALAFAPDDSFVAAALSDGTIRLHRLGDPDLQPTELMLAGHSSFIQDLAFAPDGQTLASASSDRTVRLWRVTDGVSLATLRGHFGGVASIRFTPDGKNLVSGSADHTVRLWRIMNERTQ
jgi:WD40 repeat protein